MVFLPVCLSLIGPASYRVQGEDESEEPADEPKSLALEPSIEVPVKLKTAEPALAEVTSV